MGLEGPEFPEQLRYLWDWHTELRLGVGEFMTWKDYDAWTRHMGVAPDSSECQGLFYLDAIYRNPPKE